MIAYFFGRIWLVATSAFVGWCGVGMACRYLFRPSPPLYKRIGKVSLIISAGSFFAFILSLALGG